MYVSNQFLVYRLNEIKSLAKNVVDFYGDGFGADNLVLTYYGESGSSNTLSLESTSLRSQQELDVLSAITYTFNNPISVNPEAKAQLKEGESVIASSTKWNQPDEKSITFSFDDVALMITHSYVLALPEGIVSMASDSEQKNAAFDITLNGNMSKLIGLGTITPPTDEKQILSSVKASFNVPDGYKFYTPEGLANKYAAKLYQSEVSEDNQVASIQGVISQGNIVVWDLPSISLMPDTKYILYVPEGQFWVYDTNNKRANEYSNAEVTLTYLTPSVEEANLPQIEFGTPVIGTHNKGTQFEDGMKLSSLFYLDVASKGEYKSFLVSPKAIEEDRKPGYLYEITDSGDVLVKEFNVGVVSIDNVYDYYSAGRFTLNATFYEGKKYRIVIPSGIFTAGSVNTFNYVTNPELSYTVVGATPTEIKSKDCSIEEGSTVSRLYNVTWTFNGNLNIKEDGCANLKITYANGTSMNISLPLFRTSFNDAQTRVQAICTLMSSSDGNPIEFMDGWKGEITLPEGVLYAAADESIINKDIVVNFLGATPKPEVVEPEYVSLDVSFNGAHTTSTRVVKGEKVTLRIVPESWKIEKLVRYSGADDTTGDDMTEFAENGIYTSSGLNKDTRLEATLAYASPLVFSDITTGVAELPDSDIQIFSEGDNIVVKGLSGGEFITVYTMAGIAVGSHETAPDKDTVNISAATGQTYIVRVQKADGYDYAAKIMH